MASKDDNKKHPFFPFNSENTRNHPKLTKAMSTYRLLHTMNTLVHYLFFLRHISINIILKKFFSLWCSNDGKSYYPYSGVNVYNGINGTKWHHSHLPEELNYSPNGYYGTSVHDTGMYGKGNNTWNNNNQWNLGMNQFGPSMLHDRVSTTRTTTNYAKESNKEKKDIYQEKLEQHQLYQLLVSDGSFSRPKSQMDLVYII
ncbi:hypothetical protein RFI_04705 [Reticulomyxa filosa]|uniref:Uncharacterized protein n=1 Tax=Reticulomyxa filosa TaxID=46433 RepID=X6P1K3_RETFI|nr:hypothetical protein RFI_04705 [Reticulomyxa filosa]|eukprot:ETO32410.1 hypothetical protein RFI_04705 [Reticulomyxa filosa]